MKRILFPITILIAALFTSCNKNIQPVVPQGVQGEISFSLTPQGEFVEVESLSKAGEDLQADVNEFRLYIYNAQTGNLEHSWDRFADVPSVVSLDPATYRIEAKSPGDEKVKWNQPKFQGSTEVTVQAGMVETVDLVCTLSNMKVTVICTENFLAEVTEDFSVTVSTPDGLLIFTSTEITNGTAGYFDVAPLTIDIRATRKTGGEISEHRTITDVSAQDHHVFRLDAGSTGYADLTSGISIDYSCNNKQTDIFVDNLEENPIEDEPVVDNPDNPGGNTGDNPSPDQPQTPEVTISATAGIDTPVTYSKAALPTEFNLSATAESGIASFVVNINSAGLRSLLDMMQMGYTVDLANMNAAEENFWGALFGITSADVKDQTSVTFQIAAFLSAMPNETNELELVVTGNNGGSDTRTLTIIMTE